MRFLLLLLLATPTAFANDPRCLAQLGNLIGTSATLIETGASDGKPLRLTLSNYSESSAALNSSGIKDGRSFSMVTGRFTVTNCQLTGSGVRFRMSSGSRSINITQNGNSFRASAGILWASEFVLR